jgi:uncharacterized protein YndB with AHSA1/START domain
MKNDFVAAVGHRFRLLGEWGGSLDCEVLVVEINRALSCSWNFDSDDPALRLCSTVTFSLTPTTAGTRLRVEQRGFLPAQLRAYAGAKTGWDRFLTRLAEVVDPSL